MWYRNDQLGRKSISLERHEDRDATRDNPHILIYFIHNERTRKNREKERKEKETEIRSEVHVPQSSSQDYYTPLSRSSPPHRTRIYTQTGKYATQVSGIQWHETALRYSTFTLDRKEMGEREESEKERTRRKKKALWKLL